jgi:alpha-1,2-mannosyltransferase
VTASQERVRADGPRLAERDPAGGVLVAGVLTVLGVVALVFYLAIGWPRILAFSIDLNVYRDAGLIVRHVRPLYDPRQASALYGSLGPRSHGLRFAYPPFAALPFALLSYLSLHALGWIFALADLLAVPSVIWITVRALGVPGRRYRAGLMVLATAAALLTEPVWRVIALGQVEIMLMILIVWDLCQPDTRWWKGAGVGLAAGIKLVPLVFIPYLLLTRRFREAGVAACAFAATVAIGFVALPRDSSRWWLHGLFVHESYQRNTVYAGNQSLLAVIVRAGGPAWHAEWLAAAVVTGVVGLAAAALLDRAGQRMLGLVACALTSLLVSPISWDHHWVWMVVAAPVLVHYATRWRGPARWTWLGLGVIVAALFAAWPTLLWGETRDRFGWNLGVIWAAPNGLNRETSWHGFQLIVGNAYVLTGLGVLVLLAAAALRTRRASRLEPAGVLDAESVTATLL